MLYKYWIYYNWDSDPKRKWQAKQYLTAIEKGLPIPNTGGRRKRYGYFRRPHHMNIDRERYNEHDFKFKRLHDVPDAWDDCNRGDWNSKNWKRYRKHQWRE